MPLGLYTLNSDVIVNLGIDLVMPEKGDVDTFDRIKELKPDLKTVLYSRHNYKKFGNEFSSIF